MGHFKYTLFANASLRGTPPIRALFFDFPDEPELFTVDKQWLVGRDLLVTPVLTPNVSTVEGRLHCHRQCSPLTITQILGIFPGRGRVIWRDWYTHEVLNATIGGNTTLSAPLGHVPVHIRDGSVLLLHAEPAYTVYETRQGPLSLLVSQAADGYATGNAYLDDGESVPPTPSTTLNFVASEGRLEIQSHGNFHVNQSVESVTVLGAKKPTKAVTIGERKVTNWTYTDGLEELKILGLSLDLNEDSILSWS